MTALAAAVPLRRLRGAVRQNPLVSIAVTLLAGFALVLVLHPLLMPFDPMVADGTGYVGGISLRHLFGTDSTGLDVLSRLLHGTRYAVLLPLAAMVLALVVGVPLGLVAGMHGGLFDRFLRRLDQAVGMVPGLLLALALVAGMGHGYVNVVITIGLLDALVFARAMRAEAWALRERGFVEAAVAAGNPGWRVVAVHLLPNTVPWLLALVPRRLAVALGTLSAMGYLGLAGAPTSTEWGAMVRLGAEDLLGGHWWAALFPGLAIALLGFAWRLLGTGLADLRRARMAGAQERILGVEA
jgi:peptide/nickel transport system permease protein